MEDGLVHKLLALNINSVMGLNPCCNGRWSRTRHSSGCIRCCRSLNPCCNGRWSLVEFYVEPFKILEYGLNPCCNGRWSRTHFDWV